MSSRPPSSTACATGLLWNCLAVACAPCGMSHHGTSMSIHRCKAQPRREREALNQGRGRLDLLEGTPLLCRVTVPAGQKHDESGISMPGCPPLAPRKSSRRCARRRCGSQDYSLLGGPGPPGRRPVEPEGAVEPVSPRAWEFGFLVQASTIGNSHPKP